MRIINNNPELSSSFGSNIETIFGAILMREAQNLAMNPNLDGKAMVKLEKLMSLYYKCVKVDKREEFKAYLQQAGINNSQIAEDPFYKKLMDAMADTPQISE